MNRTIRILLVDDHTLFRESLRRVLEAAPGLQVIGAVASADEAVGFAREHKPDVVLMDIDMPGRSSFDAADQIRRMLDDTRIIFLSGHVINHFIDQALKIKVSGYLAKTETPANVIEAVRQVMEGKSYFSSEVKSRVVSDAGADGGGEKLTSRGDTLSDREVEVLRYLAKGMTKKEIAAAMHISVKTVEGHAQKIMNKLDIHDRVELARYALREGLVTL